MPPVVIAAGVAAVGAGASAAINASAAKKAAKAQTSAANAQIAAAQENRDYQYNLNAPTIRYGDNASRLYAGFLGAGDAEGTPDWSAYLQANPDVAAAYQADGRFSSPEEYAQYHYNNYGKNEGRNLVTAGAGGGSADALTAFRSSTGYQDLLKEGLGAVNASAYASGKGDSGAALKALQDRGTSIANSSAQQWLGNLGNLMSAGGQARGLVAGIGTNTVNSTNQATQSAADATSNAGLISANNTSQAIQSLLNAGAYAYGSSYNNGSGLGTTGQYGTYQTPPYAGYGLNRGYA